MNPVDNDKLDGVDLERRKQFKTIVRGSALASFLEFYDYFIVVFFADEISRAFFPPHHSEEATLLEAFGLNGAAYLARPFGSLLFGWISDKYGRRNALMISLAMMGIPSFLIGCLPTYGDIGYASTVLVFTLRVVQGLAVAGEYTNAIIYLYEQCSENYNNEDIAFGQSLMWFGTCGGLLCSIEKIIIDNTMSDHDRNQIGWRIPFWIGIIIVLAGFVIRRVMPSDTVEDSFPNPIGHVFKNISAYIYPMSVIFLIFTVTGVATNATFHFLTDYLIDLHEPKDRQATVGFIISGACGMFTMIYIGYSIDKYRIEFVKAGYLFNFIAVIAMPVLGAMLYYAKNLFLVTLLQVLFGIVCLAGNPAILSFIVTYIKDRNLRATLIGIPWNVGYVIAGFTSEILTGFASIDGVIGMILVGIFVSFWAVISIIGLYLGDKYPYTHVDIKVYDEIKDVENVDGYGNGDGNDDGIDEVKKESVVI